MADLPLPHRIVTKVRHLTEVQYYRSIERLAGLLFVDKILQHNHGAQIKPSACGHCGYQMNYYDLIYYTVRVGIHPRELVKDLLKKPPRELMDVTFTDVQCVECGHPVTVPVEGYYCLWLTERMGTDVLGEVKTPLPIK